MFSLTFFIVVTALLATFLVAAFLMDNSDMLATGGVMLSFYLILIILPAFLATSEIEEEVRDDIEFIVNELPHDRIIIVPNSVNNISKTYDFEYSSSRDIEKIDEGKFHFVLKTELNIFGIVNRSYLDLVIEE